MTASLRRFASVAVLPLAMVCGAANAQVCQGKAFIDSVYQTGLGGNSYEYHIQIRNGNPEPVKVTLSFRQFPKEISLFSADLPNVDLGAYGSRTLKFGKGTNGNINMNTVKIGYDTTPGGTGATATMSRCVT